MTNWIPCSERLPEHPIPSGTKEAHKGYRYLVSLNTGKVHIAIWRFYVGGMNANGLIGVWSWNRQYRNKIIAWSELPTPYHPD